MTWLAILAILAQTADAAVSCQGIHSGRMYEANPILPNSCAGIVAVKVSTLAVVPLLPRAQRKWALGVVAVAGSVGVTVSLIAK